jgi:16S rRNA (guanine527-N7)-methyltransferase
VKQLSAEEFFASVAVSRETEDKLRAYAELLTKWQAKINLVGPATIPDLWRRHFLDSAQLFPHLPDGPVLDLGSGAGFPGLVLAVMRGQGDPVHLVESDGRKGAFLREAARITGAPAVIHTSRIEALKIFEIGAVTARALAPVATLLALAEPFLTPSVQCLFLKGERLEDELTEAGKDWKMTLDRIPSVSDPNGFILSLKEVSRGR